MNAKVIIAATAAGITIAYMGRTILVQRKQLAVKRDDIRKMVITMKLMSRALQATMDNIPEDEFRVPADLVADLEAFVIMSENEML